MEQTRNSLIFCWRAVVCSLASAGRRRRVHYLHGKTRFPVRQRSARRVQFNAVEMSSISASQRFFCASFAQEAAIELRARVAMSSADRSSASRAAT